MRLSDTRTSSPRSVHGQFHLSLHIDEGTRPAWRCLPRTARGGGNQLRLNGEPSAANSSMVVAGTVGWMAKTSVFSNTFETGIMSLKLSYGIFRAADSTVAVATGTTKKV